MKIVIIVALFLFLGSSGFALIQGYERDEKLSNKANRMLRELHQRTMPFLSEILSRKPTTEDLPQGWGCVTKDTSTPAVYGLAFNIGGTIVSVELVTGDK